MISNRLEVDTYNYPFILSGKVVDAEGNDIDTVFMITPPILDGSLLAKILIDRAIERQVRRIVVLSGSIQHCGRG